MRRWRIVARQWRTRWFTVTILVTRPDDEWVVYFETPSLHAEPMAPSTEALQ